MVCVDNSNIYKLIGLQTFDLTYSMMSSGQDVIYLMAINNSNIEY